MILALTTRLFFDASCLFTAADSPRGGSAYLLSVCIRGFLQPVVSIDVLVEAERNLVDKRPPDAFHRYRRLAAETPFVIPPSLAMEEIVKYEPVFFEDAHVVAAALAGRCEFLITLDHRLQQRVEQANLGVTALSPGEFLQTVLPEHPEYARIRQEG